MVTDHPDYEPMDEESLGTYLGEGGTGVLSLSRGAETPPYSVPVSYGYDADDGQFFFRLAADERDELLAGGGTFVTYDVEDRRWRSVVASGPLEPVSEVDVASGVLESLRRVHIPLYDVFDRPSRQVSFGFYRMVPETMTGRRSPDA